MPGTYRLSEIPWDSYRDRVKKIVLEEGITGIGQYLFSHCENLTSLEISESVSHIGEYAFYNCAFDTVYFTGTREEWNSMDITYADEENAAWNTLNTVAVYCYSETAPSGEGNYWHYAADGITPVKW